MMGAAHNSATVCFENDFFWRLGLNHYFFLNIYCSHFISLQLKRQLFRPKCSRKLLIVIWKSHCFHTVCCLHFMLSDIMLSDKLVSCIFVNLFDEKNVAWMVLLDR
jgi:hypothetical protein